MLTSKEIILRDLRFAAFKTQELRASITEQLRAAVVTFLCDRVLPYLTVEFTRMTGSITSYYDAPEFVHRPELTCRYIFELSFHSAEGADEVDGEMVFDKVSGTCHESHIRPFGIHALKPPPPLSAGGPPSIRGVCPKCSSAVKSVKPGRPGHWSGALERRPAPYVNSLPVSGWVYAAVCETCGLELTTFKVGTDEPDPANEVWEEIH